jgi:hypothetical protein
MPLVEQMEVGAESFGCFSDSYVVSLGPPGATSSPTLYSLAIVDHHANIAKELAGEKPDRDCKPLGL